MSQKHFIWFYLTLSLKSARTKGMFRPIFCIDINTHSDRKWKTMYNLLKKLFLQNVLVFINLFYRYYYPRYFIYSDYVWRHMCTRCNSIIIFTWSTETKHFFFCIEIFSVDHGPYSKKWERSFTFKSNLNIKNLKCILIKQMISCILYNLYL